MTACIDAVRCNDNKVEASRGCQKKAAFWASKFVGTLESAELAPFRRFRAENPCHPASKKPPLDRSVICAESGSVLRYCKMKYEVTRRSW